MGGNTSLFRPEAAENAVEILHGDIDLFHARADIDDAVGELGLGAAELAVAGHAGAVLPDAELVLAIAIVREDEAVAAGLGHLDAHRDRSEEHTSELQSLMRISYAVFCLKKKNIEYKHN